MPEMCGYISGTTELVAVVQFEERFVSGHTFRYAVSARNLKPALAAGAVGKPQRLKPPLAELILASLKRCPDTNLLSTCTTTRK